MTIERDLFLEAVGLSEEALKKLTSPLRSLSPRESARCFGFPDWFALSRSNNDAFFQFGNSIAVPIAMKIADYISATSTSEFRTLYVSQKLCIYFQNIQYNLFEKESQVIVEDNLRIIELK